jgi:hypothetical protein
MADVHAAAFMYGRSFCMAPSIRFFLNSRMTDDCFPEIKLHLQDYTCCSQAVTYKNGRISIHFFCVLEMGGMDPDTNRSLKLNLL